MKSCFRTKRGKEKEFIVVWEKQWKKFFIMSCIGVVLWGCSATKSIVPEDDLLLDTSMLDKLQELGEEDSDRHYYKALGGESIGWLANLLYGSSQKKDGIFTLNPALEERSTVKAGERVYFSFDEFYLQPKLLTKDLVERYKDILLSKLIAKRENIRVGKLVVREGDTLQKISKRLYGSHRLWTELYLLNQDSIAHYDHISVGAKIAYYKTGEAGEGVLAVSDPAEDVLFVGNKPLGELANDGPPKLEKVSEKEPVAVAEEKPELLTQEAREDSQGARDFEQIRPPLLKKDAALLNSKRGRFFKGLIPVLLIAIGFFVFLYFLKNRKQKKLFVKNETVQNDWPQVRAVRTNRAEPPKPPVRRRRRKLV